MYTVFSILIVLWLVGLVGHVGGNYVHLLLVVAGVLFIIQLLTGRTAV